MSDNVLTRLHHAFNDRDAETLRALLAEDVIWHIPGDHPMAGTYEGREAMWEGFAARMRFKGVEVARVRDGQVAERWAFDEREEDLDRLITQAMQRMSQ